MISVHHTPAPVDDTARSSPAVNGMKLYQSRPDIFPLLQQDQPPTIQSAIIREGRLYGGKYILLSLTRRILPYEQNRNLPFVITDILLRYLDGLWLNIYSKDTEQIFSVARYLLSCQGRFRSRVPVLCSGYCRDMRLSGG